MGATAGFAVMAGNSVVSGITQAKAFENQASFQKQQSEINAEQADYAAKDAIKRGDEEANLVKKKAKQLIGTQRAALAAQGIDVNEGSAMEVQEDTKRIAAQDARTIRNNAIREALGYKQAAANATASGNFAFLSGTNNARSTVLTGGMKALEYGVQGYGEYQKRNPSDPKKG